MVGGDRSAIGIRRRGPVESDAAADRDNSGRRGRDGHGGVVDGEGDGGGGGGSLAVGDGERRGEGSGGDQLTGDGGSGGGGSVGETPLVRDDWAAIGIEGPGAVEGDGAADWNRFWRRRSDCHG